MKHPTLRSVAFTALFALAGPSAARDLRVPAEAATIQEALDQAADGDTVLVAPGEYLITAPLSFNRLSIPGDPTTPPVKNLTLRSENGPAETIIRMSDAPADPAEASVVVFEKGEGRASALEGFTLTGGKGRVNLGGGGGLLCWNGSSPTLTNCWIVKNDLYSRSLSGGGILSNVSAPRLVGCKISSNSGASGGGLFAYHNGPTSPSVELEGCTISGNRASTGGGLFLSNGAMKLTGCELSNNFCFGNGGGGFGYSCAVSLTDCRVTSNQAGYGGGGLEFNGSTTLSLDHVTMTGNLTYPGQGAILLADSKGTITNSIIWENAGQAIFVPSGNQPVVDHSCLQGKPVFPGAGNINQDPRFCAWSGGEVFVDGAGAAPGDGSQTSPFTSLADAVEGFSVALTPSSPCIASGKNGTSMGAALGACDEPGWSARLVHLAPGSYPVIGLNLVHQVSLAGAGAEGTLLEGTVRGLQDGALLSDVTVKGGDQGGVRFELGGTAKVLRCRITGKTSLGIYSVLSSPLVQGTDITGTIGSGAYLEQSSPTFLDCVFSANVNPYGVGGGLYCWNQSHPVLERCTIVGNLSQQGGGLFLQQSTATLTSCIVWSNSPNSIATGDTSTVQVAASDLEGGTVWPGAGNLNLDPRFCGLGDGRDLFVDGQSPAPGDGSAAHPYSELNAALVFLPSLASTSPCLGSGKDGADMGAARGICGPAPATSRQVHVAAGTYALDVSALPTGLNLAGAGPEQTTVVGSVVGLRSGVRLAELTITGGSLGGLSIAEGASPEIENCVFRGIESLAPPGNGVLQIGASSSPTFRGCAFTDNLQGQFCCPSTIFCDGGSTPLFEDCTIARNGVAGMQCNSATPSITGAIISDNRGGGIRLNSSSPAITDTSITGNTTLQFQNGAGLDCEGGSNPTLENCLIARNTTANAGGGVFCQGSSPVLSYTTLVGNNATLLGSGLYLVDSSPTLESCILWDNPGESIRLDGAATVTVNRSVIPGESPWEGDGNLNQDPLFCGWGAQGLVHVDAASPGPGDGSAASPFRDLESALDFRLSLSRASPCIGAGLGGTNIGANTDLCDGAGVPSRRVILAAGTYPPPGGLSLVHRASLDGAGAGVTVIAAGLSGLRSGEHVASLTISGALGDGLAVGAGESPELSDLVIEKCSGNGLVCGGGSSPRVERCEIADNYLNGVVIWVGAAPVFEDCRVHGNTGFRSFHRGNYGGFFVGVQATVVLRRCSLTDGNTSGIYSQPESTVTLEDCLVSGNNLGGFFAFGTTLTLTRCAITGNRGPGGLLLFDGTKATLEDCLVAGNVGYNQTGGLTAYGTAAFSLSSCTLTQNRPDGTGPEIFFQTGDDTYPVISNSIVWSADGSESILSESGISPVVSYSLLSGGQWSGDGVLYDDPAFVNLGQWDDGGTSDNTYDDRLVEGDFHLQGGSPAIDAGTQEGVALGADLEGHGRVCGAGIDLGCYEFDASGGCPVWPPFIARFTLSSAEGTEPLDVDFDASSSLTEGVNVTARQWDFGDGATGEGIQARHTYTRTGTYRIVLSLADDHGRVVRAAAGVTVHFRSGDVSPWTSQDVGAPAFSGGARYEGECLRVAGCGRGPGVPSTDQFQFIQRPLDRDATLVARLDGLSDPGAGKRAVGIMLRESLDPGARFFALLIEQGSYRIVRRATRDKPAVTKEGPSADGPVAWVKLERANGLFTGSYSSDGWSWTSLLQYNLSTLPNVILGGALVSVTDDGIVGTFNPPAVDICLEAFGGGLPSRSKFHRGDVNVDGNYDLTDGIDILGHLFLGNPAVILCERSADIDDSGSLDVTDAIDLLQFLFSGGAPPAAPFRTCGADLRPGGPPCESFPPCN